jgi:hypothetical protein
MVCQSIRADLPLFDNAIIASQQIHRNQDIQTNKKHYKQKELWVYSSAWLERLALNQ